MESTKRKFFLFFVVLFCCTASMLAQQNGWSGRVVDANTNEPLIGVSIQIRGTGTGTISDFDGNFTLSGSIGDVISISYVGYKAHRIKLTARKNLGIIKLSEDSETLDEVIVVGYGVQKKASSVGSIVSAKGDDLLKVGSVTSVSEALQGQMPGVVAINTTSKPGEDAAELFIRGKATWEDASPLVLVDGIERDFNDVDVNEIESISVLKDASATAVYGVKGANGVILLTTKRGSNEKPKISFSSNFGFKLPSASPEWGDYATAMSQYNIAQANDGNWGALRPESEIAAWRNAIATGNYGPYNDVFPQVDWWDEVVRNVGYQQNYNINIRGGTEKMAYFVSLGYLNDGDIFDAPKQEQYDPSFNYKRYNWRSNFDFNITKSTKFSVNVAGNLGYQNQPAYQNGNDEKFFLPLMNTPSNEFPIKYSDGIWGKSKNSNNPIALLTESGSRNTKSYQGFYDFILNQKLDFITKGLSLKATLSYTTSSSWLSQLVRGMILGANDLNASESLLTVYRTYDYANPNPDGSYNIKTQEYFPEGSYSSTVDDLPLGGSYDGFKKYSRKLYYEVALNYARKFGNHDVTGLFLFNRKMNESTTGAAMEFPSYEEDWVGRVTYNYDQRYLFEFNGAYTGSEKFAPGKRFGFFPSASVGWRIHEEPWIKNITKEYLTNLKIRYSYGMVGNDKGATRFNYFNEFSQSGNVSFGLNSSTAYGPVYIEQRLGDSDATWETSVKQNLGLEIGLWGNLNITLDLFDEHRSNILMARKTIPSWAASSVAFPEVNLGKTKNHGLELDISYNNKIGKFNYFARFNFATSENRVVFKDDPKNQLEYLKAEGKPIGYASKYLANGNFQSLDDIFNSAQSTINNGLHNKLVPGDLYYIDFNGDGIISSYDSVPVEALSSPYTTLGLTLGGSYKGFSFRMLWYSALDVYKDHIGGYLWDFPSGVIKVQPNTLETWSADNPLAEGPVRPSLHIINNYNSLSSTYTYANHSYLRLKTLEISYNFPKRLIKNLFLSKFEIYANGNNLLTFSPADPRRDPETSSGSVYPIVKRYNVGFRLGF